MNIDDLEVKYLTENQREILSQPEKEHLILKKWCQDEQASKESN